MSSKNLELNADNEDALFKLLLDKIMTAHDVHQLEERTNLALSIIQRRHCEKKLLSDMRKLVADAIGGLPKDHAGPFLVTDIHHVARRCVQILETSKEKRLSRADQEALGHCEPYHEAITHGTHKIPNVDSNNNYGRRIAAVVALFVSVGGIWFLNYGSEHDEPTPAKLAEQVIAASEGNLTSVHVYGGAMIIKTGQGATRVTAHNLPPRVCAAAGWLLVRKGTLTINDTTPSRVSAAVIADLCHEKDMANISWSPKPI
jgi:hypothetical protein